MRTKDYLLQILLGIVILVIIWYVADYTHLGRVCTCGPF